MIILIILHKKEKKNAHKFLWICKKKKLLKMGNSAKKKNQRGQDKKGSGWEKRKPQGDWKCNFRIKIALEVINSWIDTEKSN